MKNKSAVKVAMNEQKPEIRIQNFEEVALGYQLDQAMEEALRCLQCKSQPCVIGCPVNTPIPEFIAQVAEGNIEKAYEIIAAENNLPAICGRVCPQEVQCEGKCIRGIKGEPVAIGRLERFVADFVMEHTPVDTSKIVKNGIKVAVVGAGPAGLSCAAELAKMGYEVTIFEALHIPGGVLMYGIPEFRLPKKLVEKEIQRVKDLGVNIITNVLVGRSITVDELIEEHYQAVFIGSGAGLPKFLGIPGENLNGVYTANEFLTRSNLMKAYDFPNNPTPVKIGQRVAVIGGGNVAMDAARTAKRLGAKEVYIVYRRSLDEMPARAEEVHHAQEEQINFHLLTNPLEIQGDDGWVSGLRCSKMELGAPDASGRRRPVEVPNSDFILPLESVILAIGQSPNPLIRQTTEGLDTHHWGGIIVEEENMKTTKDRVYAGGDAVTGAATVILAMGAGKTAAKAIHEQIVKGM